jgi:hypothetical protein
MTRFIASASERERHETSPPQVLASGRGRCRTPGLAALRLVASFSDGFAACPSRNRAARDMAKHRLARSGSRSLQKARDRMSLPAIAVGGPEAAAGLHPRRLGVRPYRNCASRRRSPQRPGHRNLGNANLGFFRLLCDDQEGDHSTCTARRKEGRGANRDRADQRGDPDFATGGMPFPCIPSVRRPYSQPRGS